MRICEHHFEKNDFTSSNKQRLKKMSVPQMFSAEEEDILHVTTPKKNIRKNKSNNFESQL